MQACMHMRRDGDGGDGVGGDDGGAAHCDKPAPSYVDFTGLPGRKWRPSPPTARTPRHLSLLTEAIQLLRKRLVRRLCSHGRDESLWADSPRRALAASAASARVAAFCASEQLRPCPRCHAINMTSGRKFQVPPGSGRRDLIAHLKRQTCERSHA